MEKINKINIYIYTLYILKSYVAFNLYTYLYVYEANTCGVHIIPRTRINLFLKRGKSGPNSKHSGIDTLGRGNIDIHTNV